MLTVCTGFSPAGYEQYGKHFLDTFARFVDPSVRLLCYIEDMNVKGPRAEFVSLWDCPGVRQFICRHRDNPVWNGRSPGKSWKESERAAGYSFKWDAVRFCRQGYIPLHAAEKTTTPFLAWFDADVVFTAPVTAKQIVSLLPDGKAVAYLGRPPKHSEIGFQLYRLPDAMPHLRMFRNYYESRKVFDLAQWHSAYVFDAAREASGIAGHNLTPGKTGHVWLNAPLARFCVHLKGARKKDARKIAAHAA